MFNPIIIRIIQNRETFTAGDVLVKGLAIGGYQFITNINKDDKVENSIYSNQQIHNTPKVAETNILLNIVVIINEKGRDITQGKIVITTNNKKYFK